MPYSYHYAYKEIQFGHNTHSAVILLLLSGFRNSNAITHMFLNRFSKLFWHKVKPISKSKAKFIVYI